MIWPVQQQLFKLKETQMSTAINHSSSNWRQCSAQETFARNMPLTPAMGITRIANVTGLDTLDIPVYTAHRPNSRSLSVMQGKGCTHHEAKTSALMEAIETYHAENINLPLYLCDYLELSCGHKIVDVSKMPQPKNNPFTPHSRILWIEGTDLISGEKKLVPYEAVHLDYTTSKSEEEGSFITSSNGLASGNSITESHIHGICELIERDALSLWYLKSEEQQQANKIDTASLTNIRHLELINKFRKSKINIGIWDISSDTGVPAFLCRILPETTSDISGIRPASGIGCHLSKDIALSRALTEAAQSRLSFISGVRDDMSRKDYEQFLSLTEYKKWHKNITEGDAESKDFQEIKSLDTGVTEEDLKLLLQKLTDVGITEAVSVDLTKAEFNIAVTKVIVPGLEGIPSNKDLSIGKRAQEVIKENNT